MTGPEEEIRPLHQWRPADPPEYEPDDGEAQRIAETYADAAAELTRDEAGGGVMAEIERAIVQGVAVCDARASECRCRQPAGHYPATAHVCDPRCGGSWRGADGGDDFEVVAWPQGEGIAPDDFISAILTAPLIAPIPGLGADEEW